MTRQTLKRLCPTLLLAGVCVVGCNSSDAHVRDNYQPRRGNQQQVVVDFDVANTEREAQVKELGRVLKLAPEVHEEMVEQEAALQERGIPGYRPIYVRNYFQVAYVDPQTKKLAFRGMTCTHADCTGQGYEGGPFVFPDVVEGLRVGPDGEIIGTVGGSSPSCPACNRSDAVERYTPPDALQRRGELQAQLNAIRLKRDEARRSGLPLPPLTVTPRELMSGIANLPSLYLVEE